MEPNKMSMEDLQTEMAKLREQVDMTKKRLRALVAEHDLRVELEELRRTRPKLAQMIENAGGICSEERVGTPKGAKS